ncbi:MAG TPA: sigma-70 family RNA polymerase sigma factor, partial [Rhodanobacteraceae bacterium]|nr:sigma-70 family RNA polymerase sigma factor [Rhodanobacteraceae bacterium]
LDRWLPHQSSGSGRRALPYQLLEDAPESPRWAEPRADRDEAARSESVQKLFFEHNRALVRFLAAKLNSEAEARDVAQEAYVRLLQLDRPDAIGFLRTYLFRVAENIANDHLRHRAVHERSQPTQQVLFEQLLNRPGPDRSAMGQEELQIVRQALRDLPAKCRKAFVLHVFAERPLAEIAVEMQLSDRMIRYYVARAMAHCSAALDTTR